MEDSWSPLCRASVFVSYKAFRRLLLAVIILAWEGWRKAGHFSLISLAFRGSSLSNQRVQLSLPSLLLRTIYRLAYPDLGRFTDTFRAIRGAQLLH